MFKRILPFIIFVFTASQAHSQVLYITPVDTTVCYNENQGHTLNLQNNIRPVQRWEMSESGSDPWITIAIQTNDLDYDKLTKTTWFRAVVQASGEPEMTSATAVVNVNHQAIAGFITGLSNVCAGTNSGQLTLSGQTGAVQHWEASTDSSIWSYLAGSEGATVYTYSNLPDTTWFKALVVSGNNCTPVDDNIVRVTAYDPSNAGSITGSATVCQGANSGAITISGNNGSIVRWESSPTGSSPWASIAETGNTLNYSNLQNTTYFHSVVKNGVCPEIASQTATIAVNAPSQGGTTLGGTDVCSKVNSGQVSLTGQQGNVTKWQYSVNGGTNWTDTAVTQTSITYNNLTQSRIYRTEIQNGVCSPVLSSQTTIVVNPLPVVNFTAPSQPQGNPVSFTNSTTIASGNLKQYFWDFGDGSSSTAKNPLHTFENPGTYKVKLEVTTDKGCLDSISKDVEVYEVPQVNFVYSNVCLKDEAHFVNASAISYPTPAYSWDFGDGSPIATELNAIHKYTAPGTYQVTLTVSTPYSSASKTKSIEIYFQATPAFEAPSVCLGSNMLFLNKSKINAGYLTYSWNFGDGKTSTDLNPVYSYATADSFTVRLITLSNYNCRDTIYKNVRVHPAPAANFAATSVPFGNPVVFTNSSTISKGNLSHSWDFDDGNTSSVRNPQHTYSSAGNYLVTLSVQSDSGCMSSLSKMVWIYPKPHASFVVSPVCVYDSARFENQSTISSGTMSYFWQFGDSGTSVLKNPLWKYKRYGTYTVTLIVNSNQGGGDTITKTIEIYPEPTANFTADNVCDGFSVEFQDQSSIATGSISSYLWDFGDGSNAVRQAPVKQYLNPDSYNVTLSVVSDKNCKATIVKPVTVYPNPVANFTVAGVCFMQQVFPVNLSQVTTDATFQWNMGDGSQYSISAPSHIYQSPGLYPVKLTVTDLNGCQDSLVRNVNIYPLPEVNAGHDTSIVLGFPVQLNATGGVSFEWYPAEGLSSVFIKNPVASPQTTTTYFLTTQDQYGCVNRDTITISVEDHQVLIATNVLTPDGNGKNDTWYIQNIVNYPDAEITIFNRWGTIVFHAINYQNDWDGTNSNNDILPDGAYYYVITMPNSDLVYKGTVTIMRNK